MQLGNNDDKHSIEVRNAVYFFLFEALIYIIIFANAGLIQVTLNLKESNCYCDFPIDNKGWFSVITNLIRYFGCDIFCFIEGYTYT